MLNGSDARSLLGASGKGNREADCDAKDLQRGFASIVTE
jgi:hypothetical protein